MKKVLALMLAMVLVLSLAACGQNNSNSSESAQLNVSSQSESENQTSQTTTSQIMTSNSYDTTSQNETTVLATPSTSYSPSEGFEYESKGDGTCKLTGVGKFNDDTLVIPSVNSSGDKVVEIDEYALYKCKSKTLVISGMTLKTDTSAFSYSNFESVIIDASELTLGDSALENCDDISSITVINSKLTCGEYAFYKVGSDTDISFDNSTISLDKSTFSYGDIKKLKINSCNITYSILLWEVFIVVFWITPN